MSETATDVAIRVENVVKAYDNGIIRALDGVSLSVKHSEFVSVSGPSGCGKSTLLHLIARLDAPTSGKIYLRGRDLEEYEDLDKYRRSVIGLVFQMHNLLPHLTTLQNVEIAMFGNGMSHKEQRDKARLLLEEVGLAAREKNTPPKLSGGERQRVAIARALANDPQIILADEPTGSLDTVGVQRILELISRIRQERGVEILLVTHDPSVAAAADRQIHMRDGKIVD